MSGTALSRRVNEFFGVALFGLALVWLIALTTYDPADAVWFFNTGGQAPPANFVGRVGAFLAELSYQVLGFAAYPHTRCPGCSWLALLLVPHHRRRLHEGRRAFPDVRVYGLLPGFGIRCTRSVRKSLSGRWLSRKLAWKPAGRVSQPHRLDHRNPDNPISLGHLVDTVLIWSDLLRCGAIPPPLDHGVGSWPPEAGGLTGAESASARRSSRSISTRRERRLPAQRCSLRAGLHSRGAR